jgi:hypothetical protein
MDTGSENIHGNGDDDGLYIGYTEEFAWDQSNEAEMWLYNYGDRRLPDHWGSNN